MDRISPCRSMRANGSYVLEEDVSRCSKNCDYASARLVGSVGGTRYARMFATEGRAAQAALLQAGTQASRHRHSDSCGTGLGYMLTKEQVSS